MHRSRCRRHTGIVFFGVVSGEGAVEITALGDPLNVAARLVTRDGAGEVLISEATCAAARIDSAGLEPRHLELKGRTDHVDVRVLRVAPK